MPALEAAAGRPVIGSVSVRHDPMDVVEDVLRNEPIDEIILAVSTHFLARSPTRSSPIALPTTPSR